MSCLVTFVSMGQDDKSYIEVMGSAGTEISPNIIIVSIGLKEYEESKEKVSLEQIERDFLSAVLPVNTDNKQ